MDLIKIVDQNGNFTGITFTKEDAYSRNLVRNEVVIFILNDKNQVLLQKRSSNKKYHPNKWALCTGHVEKIETEDEAAIREIKEEIGIKVAKENLHKCFEEEWTLRDNNTHITFFYYTKINKKENEFIIQEDELSEVKWYDINDVIDMIINKNDNIVFTEKRLDLFQQLKNLHL